MTHKEIEINLQYALGEIDRFERDARIHGLQKNWSEPKILRRAKVRRVATVLAVRLWHTLTGGYFQ